NRPAVDRLAAVLGEHRLHRVGVADPDGDGHVAIGADEPGVTVVLGRAGLAPEVWVTVVRIGTGSLRDHAVEHGARRGGDGRGDDLLGLDPVLTGVALVGLHRVVVRVVDSLDPYRASGGVRHGAAHELAVVGKR